MLSKLFAVVLSGCSLLAQLAKLAQLAQLAMHLMALVADQSAYTKCLEQQDECSFAGYAHSHLEFYAKRVIEQTDNKHTAALLKRQLIKNCLFVFSRMTERQKCCGRK